MTSSPAVASDSSVALSWVAVVPVKQLDRAKTRLDTGIDGGRPALARAFATDTVVALQSVPDVCRVVVVSGDAEVGRTLRALGATVLDEPAPGGLNAAVRAGIEWARTQHPDAGVVVVSADLPALRAEDVQTVLTRARQHPRSVVPDGEGTGTTVLTALPGVALHPRFGPDSLRLHRRDGAVPLAADDLVRAARDVDTASQLAEAVRLGVGPETARVLDV